MVLKVKCEHISSSVCCLIGQSPSDPDIGVINVGDCHISWSGWRDCRIKNLSSIDSYLKTVITATPLPILPLNIPWTSTLNVATAVLISG